MDAQLERNLWAGSSGILPGLRDAAQQQDSKIKKNEAQLYVRAIQQRIAHLRLLQRSLSLK